MVVAFELARLPDPVRRPVARVLTEDAGHEEAIEAAEAFLARGGEAGPDLQVALAVLTMEDAERFLPSALGEAAARALTLLDEALALGAPDPGALGEVRARCARTLRRERARERRLEDLLADPSAARPTELMELAHRVLMRGDDDGLAAALMTEAGDRVAPTPSEHPPAYASSL
ncbi:MAG TPA: hypothetical protein RMH99_14735 [Sandaracinaceae bacterium LLY-WYZ-13_1]|nr:hypothetical protein [Sandaracinaceae bacterium LLY-WYZ-13_1]